MSISLPTSFKVSTDADEVAELTAEFDFPQAQEFSDLITQFPDLFVLAGFDQLERQAASVLIIRLPMAGSSLDQYASEFAAGMDEAGFRITAETDTAVGIGDYAAARINAEGHPPGVPDQRSTIYIINGGSQFWVVEFLVPPDEYERLSPSFDQSIDSLTLRDGG